MTAEKIELYKQGAGRLVEGDESFNPATGLFWITQEKELITALLIFTDEEEPATVKINKLLSLPADELIKTLQQTGDAAPFVAQLAQMMPNIKNAVVKSVTAILQRAEQLEINRKRAITT